jgi:hypothetical protein
LERVAAGHCSLCISTAKDYTVGFFYRPGVKQFSSILLASAILLQACGGLVIYAGYEMNKEYIARAFCENKDKPAMHCDGKCHLKKVLNNGKAQSPSTSLREKQDITQFSQTTSSILPASDIRSLRILPADDHFHFQEFSPFIFHPPAA